MMAVGAKMGRMFQTQLKLTETLTHRAGNLTTISSSPEISSDMLLRSVTNFLHDPQSGVTFEFWFKRYEGMFIVDVANKDEKISVRLPLRTPGPVEHMRYANFIFAG